MKNQTGSALLLVVLILLVLSGLGIAMLTLTDSDRETVTQDDLYKDALYVAEIGLRVGETTLFATNPTGASDLLQHTSAGQTPAVSPRTPVFPQSQGEYDLAHLGTFLTDGSGTELINRPVTLPPSPAGKTNTRGFFSLYLRNNPADTSVADANPGTIAQVDNDTIVNLVSVGWVVKGSKILSVKILEEEYTWIGLAEALAGQKGQNAGSTGAGQIGG